MCGPNFCRILGLTLEVQKTAPIHYDCLKKLIDSEEKKETKQICKICNSPYRITRWKNGELICPHDDIYPPPLMTSHQSRKVVGERDKIRYAMWYLQVERVQELLTGEEKITDDLRATVLTEITSTIPPTNLGYTRNKKLYLKMLNTVLDFLPGASEYIIKSENVEKLLKDGKREMVSLIMGKCET